MVTARGIGPIDGNGLARDKRGIGRGQKGGHGGDFRWAAQTAQFMFFHDLFEHVVIFRIAQGAQHGGIDKARADGIHPNSLPAIVDSHVFGEDGHATFGGVIATSSGGAFETFHAGHGDDTSPLAVDWVLFQHGGNDVLAGEKGSGEIDANDGIPT